MHEILKDKINDIALLLVITAENDQAGISLLLEMCNEIQKQIQAEATFSRLLTATKAVLAEQTTPHILKAIQDYVTASIQFLDNSPDVVFPHETSATALPHASGTDDSALDRTFLAEYIETHSALLEEFEGNVMQFVSGEVNYEGALQNAKRYIHNLKGDSGSIGMTGVERCCHDLEDALPGLAESKLANILLAFKAWAIGYLHAYAEGSTPKESADSFLSSLRDTILENENSDISNMSEVVPTPAPSSQQVESPKVLGQTYALTGEKDILMEFIGEAEEHLNNLEAIILDAEGSYSKEAIDTIFRGVHSIKGGSAYFQIEEMTKCSHILENFLSEVRDGRRTLDTHLNGFLFTYIDLQKNVLNRAKRAGCGDGVMERAQASIDFLANLDAYGANKTESIKAGSTPPPSTSGESQNSPAAAESGDKLNLKTFVKVDTARLDLLIDSIGEMVIYSSMLIKQCRDLLRTNESVMDATHRVEKFTRDLQDIGMSMRLIPVKGLFQKMSRLVWDVGKKLGKEIVFSTEGEDTELDRNLIDKLADPLMHMVRNSLDHGIEPADEREANGKPRVGKVKLSAYHAGGSIHIRIEDDGRGLNPDKLLKKAIEKGIVIDGQKLTTTEIFQLIFAPGFSTAAAVTDISGRGVGMDVVRRNVENLRGRITIDSEVGKGSVFTIEIPLTLAIIDGMQIQVGEETFVIPTVSIIEFVRPTSEMIYHPLDHGETLNLRGKYIPIYRLANLFGVNAHRASPCDSTMVIVESNNETLALMVDDILGECSTVIKSLGGMFSELKGIAGCAIMPGGNIALILDIVSLIQLARKEYSFDGLPQPEFSSQETEGAKQLH